MNATRRVPILRVASACDSIYVAQIYLHTKNNKVTSKNKVGTRDPIRFKTHYEIFPWKIFCPEKIQITSHVPFTLFSLTLRIVPTNDGHICDPWNATDEVLQLRWRHLLTIFLTNLLAHLTALLLTCSPFTLISSFLRSTM